MGNQSERQNLALVILRWIIFFPVGYIAGNIVGLLVSSLLELQMHLATFSWLFNRGASSVDPIFSPRFWFSVVIDGLAWGLYGAVTVWVSAIIAPAYKKFAAVVSAVLLGLLSLFCLAGAVYQGDYRDVFLNACTVAGLSCAAIDRAKRFSPSTTG